MDLTENEWAFLDALRAGESAAGYARRMNYSQPWAKWISRRIRDKMNVETIGEAIAMSEVTHADLEAIRKEQEDLRKAIEKLAAASTPAQRRDAQEDVAEARADLASELRRRGLTQADLDDLEETKAYERHKARDDRLRQEREAAEAAAKPPAEGEGESESGTEGAPERQPEEQPESQHGFDRPLWGRGKK